MKPGKQNLKTMPEPLACRNTRSRNGPLHPPLFNFSQEWINGDSDLGRENSKLPDFAGGQHLGDNRKRTCRVYVPRCRLPFRSCPGMTIHSYSRPDMSGVLPTSDHYACDFIVIGMNSLRLQFGKSFDGPTVSQTFHDFAHKFTVKTHLKIAVFQSFSPKLNGSVATSLCRVRTSHNFPSGFLKLISSQPVRAAV